MQMKNNYMLALTLLFSSPSLLFYSLLSLFSWFLQLFLSKKHKTQDIYRQYEQKADPKVRF
jgi:hypothetical protein